MNPLNGNVIWFNDYNDYHDFRCTFIYVCILVCAPMHALMCAVQRCAAYVLRFP